MARFIATASGRSKTDTSRLGTGSTSATARGWHLGGLVSMHILGEERTPSGRIKSPGRDVLTISITGGSGDCSPILDLGTWSRTPSGTLIPECSRAALILNTIGESQ